MAKPTPRPRNTICTRSRQFAKVISPPSGLATSESARRCRSAPWRFHCLSPTAQTRVSDTQVRGVVWSWGRSACANRSKARIACQGRHVHARMCSQMSLVSVSSIRRRLIAKWGGLARAAKLTKKQRTASARKAARARWATPRKPTC